ncbi:MAG: hypothetical protein JRJ59_01235 [Deltaproteobacteria bacterium]|nr:hypothetical protein [Deltaproteobacteria bacterium]
MSLGRKLHWSLVGLALLALFFSGSSPAAAGGGVLKVAIGMNPSRLDPPNATGAPDMIIDSHIFERLLEVRWDEAAKSRKFVPALAQKWEASPDGKTWTFHLRQGVKFHDGTPFNAEAVKFNIERMLNQKMLMSREYQLFLAGAEVVDEYTVRLNCRLAVAPFLDMIEQSYLAMVSPAAVAKYGKEVVKNPVGTGPYRFKQWTPGQKVVLEANPDYWGGRPKMDSLEFVFVPDDMARANMLQTGEVDVAYNPPIPMLDKLAADKNLEVFSYPTAELLLMSLNNQVLPTKEVKVRQAIKLAIDRRGIVKSILKGNAEVCTSPVSVFSWGHKAVDPVKFDPQKAAALLEAAGWVDTNQDGVREKDGQNLALTIRAPSGRNPMDTVVAEAIQNQLKDIGFQAKVELMEFGAFIGAIYRPVDKATGDAFIVSWSSRSDAWYALHKTLHSGLWIPAGSNAAFYKNETVDQLLDGAMVELDPAKRQAMYEKVQRIYDLEVPMIGLWYLNSIVGQRKGVHGVTRQPIPVADQFGVKAAWKD